MPEFDPLRYKYPSRRNVVYAARGMAAASVPLAAQIGIDMMKNGGNAVDAAIAMAAALPVLEPTSNGLGSDCFVLVWTGGKLYGLNGSGFSPGALNAGAVAAAGHAHAVPTEGWLPVMVPGSPAAWAALRRRFGTRSMQELLAPAISYARAGSPVPVNVARQWAGEIRRIGAACREDPVLFTPFMETFTHDGAPCGPGELFACPDMADTLEELAETDCESFYRGALMEKIVAFSKATGGFFEAEDFTGYRAEWAEPIHINYKGYEVFEMPPNGHGITALMALNILKDMDLGDRDGAACCHKMIEAVKLAFADAKKYVSDPRTMRTKVRDLLSDRYAQTRRALIGSRALSPEAGDPACGGTVYFCTADGQGNMVSFIQSNYTGFGSGVVVPGTGISLQSRGANFSMDPESDNFLEGGKRAYHTIIPGFLAKDGQPVGPFGVMGGFMQPQGHVQVVVNTVDFGMNPQECLDAPRFQWTGGRKVQLEREVPAHVAQELAAMGHEVEIVNSNLNMGRGEIIWRLPSGVLAAGAEPRCDGAAAPW